MPKKFLVLCDLLATLLAAGCQKDSHPRPRTAFLETVNTPVRVTMADLHMAGGVPPKWVFALPKGDPVSGREVFQDLGCPSCHTVAGEKFVSTRAPDEGGPDLTGMGSHHPEVYFVESILNPDAVLVEGTGYIGDDGRSNMPSYPDLTAEQLTDVVAYLKSLGSGADDHAGANPFTGRVDLGGRNLPPEAESATPAATPASRKATTFFVQTYSLRDGALAGFEDWFQTSGSATFRSFDGLLELETYVDRTRGPEWMVTVFGFADMDTLRAFVAEKRIAEALEKFDDFTDVIDRQMYESRPVYRVGTLSG